MRSRVLLMKTLVAPLSTRAGSSPRASLNLALMTNNCDKLDWSHGSCRALSCGFFRGSAAFQVLEMSNKSC